MKAQGLPITTIVIIVMVIVVLAAVLIFFFGGFGKPAGTLSAQQTLAKCQSFCTRAKSIARGRTYTSSNKNVVISNSDFCSQTYTIEGITNKKCDDLTTCTVEFDDGVAYTLTC